MSSEESGSDDSFEQSMSSDYSIESPINRWSSFRPPVSQSCTDSQMKKVEHEFLTNVWKAVWDHQSSWPFRKPVDEAHPNIDKSEYCRIIKNPMDLETIRLRLKNRFYEFADDCIQDFKTIFTNCYVYFTIKEQNKDIFEMAMLLKDFFLKRIKSMPKKKEIVVNSRSTMMEKKRIFFSIWVHWTMKLEDVPEDELRLIFSLLSFEDLKNLKLVSKKCALMVTQYDRRLNHWSVTLKRILYSPIVPVEIFETLNYARERDYFPDIDISLNIDGYQEPEIRKKALEMCKDNIVNLDIQTDGDHCQDGDIDPLYECHLAGCSTVDHEEYISSICIPKLIELTLDGCTCAILRNTHIAETVRSITLKSSCSLTRNTCVFPELKYLYCSFSSGDISKLICPQLSKLVVLSSRQLDYEKVPMMPTLKKLIVDATTVSLLNKCSDNVEDLTFTYFRSYQGEKLVVPDELICPKLKQLAFGQNCPPNWKFIMNQTSTLEMLVVPGMLNRNDPYPFSKDEFDFNEHTRINAYDLDKLQALIRDSPCLHTLVLPSNLKNKIRDETGKVKIFFNIQDAAKVLSLNTRFLFQSQLDRYLPLQ